MPTVRRSILGAVRVHFLFTHGLYERRRILTDNLTVNQRRAIVYLIEKDTITAAAEATGVTRQTLHSWLQQPDFQAAYRSAKREIYGHAVAKLQRHASRAADVLYELMTSDNETVSPGVRLGAARSVLDLAAGGSMDDLAAEVEEMKRLALPEAGRAAN